MKSFQEFAAVARSEAAPKITSILPETSAPVQQISRLFAYQSYFDNTLLENAILLQNRNEPIVSSTVKEEQIPGYAIGLHPSSQTPVALQFKIGGQPTSSQAIILKPGQIVRPHGLPRGMSSGAFSGFRWGLPFGWLGGGVATLLVFQTPDADVAWPGNPEVIFHRQRMKILDPAVVTADAPYNWPVRFPWTQAFQGANAISQQGQPAIAVEPTRVLMRLRMDTLGAAAVMRVLIQASNDFDLDSAGDPVLTPVGFIDVTWGTIAGVGVTGNLNTQYPIVEIGEVIGRLGADDGGLRLIDATSGAGLPLADQYVDVVRYGRL